MANVNDFFPYEYHLGNRLPTVDYEYLLQKLYSVAGLTDSNGGLILLDGRGRALPQLFVGFFTQQVRGEVINGKGEKCYDLACCSGLQ